VPCRCRAHLPPDVSGRCCAGEGREGHGVQAVLLWHLVHEVAQVVVLDNKPAAVCAEDGVLWSQERKEM
jgi:hypothetical protein